MTLKAFFVWKYEEFISKKSLIYMENKFPDCVSKMVKKKERSG